MEGPESGLAGDRGAMQFALPMPAKVTSLVPRPQFAALPWRLVDGQLEVLMITSRLSRHWLIPKGWPMRGKSNAQAAAREAFEEAGIKGVISPKPIGQYEYQKLVPEQAPILCRVDVFALMVEKELAKWPEAANRDRQWMPIAAAATVAFESGLAALLATIDSVTLIGASTATGRRHR